MTANEQHVTSMRCAECNDTLTINEAGFFECPCGWNNERENARRAASEISVREAARDDESDNESNERNGNKTTRADSAHQLSERQRPATKGCDNEMTRDKIKPVIDVPLMLTLEEVYGQESTSKFTGLEYRYNVIVDGRPAFMYLPEEGRDAIVRVQPQPGDTIELLKQKQRGQIVFYCQVLGDDDAQPQQRAPQPPPRQNGGGMRMLAPAPQRQTQSVARRSQPQQPPPPQHWEDEYDQRSSYEEQPEQRAQASPPRPNVTTIHPIGQQLAGCIRAAIDAWEEGRAYAESKGRTLDYSTEDVRATALSVYIGAQRGSR